MLLDFVNITHTIENCREFTYGLRSETEVNFEHKYFSKQKKELLNNE